MELAEQIRAALDVAEENARDVHLFDCDALMGVGDVYGTCDCGEPERQLRIVEAHRTILALHRSWDDANPRLAEPDRPERACVGCGFDSQEERMVEDVNKCPVVVALADAHGLILCGARTIFWPDDECCDAECIKPRGHGGTRHQDEILGEWDEDDLSTVMPAD